MYGYNGQTEPLIATSPRLVVLIEAITASGSFRFRNGEWFATQSDVLPVTTRTDPIVTRPWSPTCVQVWESDPNRNESIRRRRRRLWWRVEDDGGHAFPLSLPIRIRIQKAAIVSSISFLYDWRIVLFDRSHHGFGIDLIPFFYFSNFPARNSSAIQLRGGQWIVGARKQTGPATRQRLLS